MRNSRRDGGRLLIRTNKVKFLGRAALWCLGIAIFTSQFVDESLRRRSNLRAKKSGMLTSFVRINKLILKLASARGPT